MTNFCVLKEFSPLFLCPLNIKVYFKSDGAKRLIIVLKKYLYVHGGTLTRIYVYMADIFNKNSCVFCRDVLEYDKDV